MRVPVYHSNRPAVAPRYSLWAGRFECSPARAKSRQHFENAR